MICVRCEQDKEIRYRVFTDIMDIKVCADCATEARELDIGIEVLETDKRTNDPAEDYMRQAS